MSLPVHAIRAAQDEDLEALNELYNHYVATSHATFDVDPITMEQRRRWLAEHPGGRHQVLVGFVDDRLAGYASSSRHRPRPAYDSTVETSAYVGPPYTGLGVGTSLYSALFDALGGEDVHRALA